MRLAISISLFVNLLGLMPSQPAFSEAAVYFSQNSGGGWSAGWAWDERTAADAALKAEDSCINNGGTNYLPAGQIFSDSCVALAIQDVRGMNGWSMQVHRNLQDAKNRAVASCQNMGVRCLVQLAFCDQVKEKIAICLHPVFREEMRLKGTLDGTPSRTEKAMRAMEYLLTKYCRSVERDALDAGITGDVANEHISDNCYQYSAMFRGEKVYWGACHE